jgi:hypothetical protein
MTFEKILKGIFIACLLCSLLLAVTGLMHLTHCP